MKTKPRIIVNPITRMALISLEGEVIEVDFEELDSTVIVGEYHIHFNYEGEFSTVVYKEHDGAYIPIPSRVKKVIKDKDFKF